MLYVINTNFVVSKIKSVGVDEFLKTNARLAQSNIEGVFHYNSLLPAFEKFIFFDFSKKKEVSLVFAEKNITLADFCANFVTYIAGYDFREDMTRMNVDGVGYIMVEGKVRLQENGITSTDASGNDKSAEEIEVRAVVIEAD